MNVLGIESSCDETAAAVVSLNGEASLTGTSLSNTVYSQTDEHFEYGGVVPEIASRAHLERISSITQKALCDANLSLSDIDGIAVTSGPGLMGGLLIGMSYAKSLSQSLNIPMIGINHLEGHALTAHLTEKVEFPYLLLLASGGHCQFIHVKTFGDYTLLSSTLDDAVGECFDKVAKMLNLSYPGGPLIEQKAKLGNETAYSFPIPMRKRGIELSFSGLKSAVRRVIMEKPNISERDTADICASLQKTISDTLVLKTKRALKECGAPTFVLAGGVAANKSLRSSLEVLCKREHVAFAAPPINLCTDNAVMIAYAGAVRLFYGERSCLNQVVTPRWPLESLTPPATKSPHSTSKVV